MKQRINKIIAQSGFCSRRKADQLILEKRVKLNSKTISELGITANPGQDLITIDDKTLNFNTKKYIYIMLHKPVGYITTTKDPHAEKTVFDLLPKIITRLYPVGRLDKDTSGLLILTDNGDLSYKLTHPKFEIKRIYEVTVKGAVTADTIKTIERGGLQIEDYLTSPCKITLVSRTQEKTKIHLSMHEGRKRQIRKIFALEKHPVIELKRIQFGKLKLGNLKPGQWRYIKKETIV
ncbi:MAG: rRNA pseudouridine synthase [Candidatus Omnitrophica bacterium]|nr:rRNA pseudouridine synthase [Candidatus Omnitrophota bacterium]